MRVKLMSKREGLHNTMYYMYSTKKQNKNITNVFIFNKIQWEQK